MKNKNFMSILWIVLVSLLFVGCSDSTETEETIVETEESNTFDDYKENFVQDRVDELESTGVEISDYKIDKFEQQREFKNIQAKDFCVYLLEYSLQFEDEEDYEFYDGYIGVGEEDQWVTEINGTNYMIFETTGGEVEYVDTVHLGEFEGSIDKIVQEENLREILEGLDIIERETYLSDHYIATFRSNVGRAGKALLSQPLDREDSMWIVERTMDENGNIYYCDSIYFEGNDKVKAIEELQEKSEEESWRKDPEKVVTEFLQSFNIGISLDSIIIEKLEDLEDFYTVPVSEYLGYVEDIKLADEYVGDVINVILAERLTKDDKDRAEALGIDIDQDMPNGYLIRETQILESIFLDEDTKYYIEDEEVSMSEFIQYVEDNPRSLWEITSKEIHAVEVRETI